MKKVEINYNPYKMITTVLIDGVDVCKDGHYDKFREFIKNEIPLQTWIEPIPYMDWAGFVNEISDPEINDEVMVIFSGRVIDFEDLKRSIADQNNKRVSPVIYHYKHKKVLDDKVLSTNIEDVVKELKSERFHDLVAQRTTEGLTQKYNDLDENYTIAKESVFYIVFAGVYSSGKSTLLNTLIRHDVLPTSTRTCTSKNCRIRHDRSLGRKLSLVCYDDDENVVVEKRIFDNDVDCANAFLDICPIKSSNSEDNYPHVSMMELGVDLSHLYPSSVSEDKFTIVLIDTPGMDSAQSSEDGMNRHAEIALNAISMESKPKSIAIGENISLYQVSKIIYDKNENTQDKLTTVYSTIFSLQNYGLAMLLNGNKDHVDLYLGVVTRNLLMRQKSPEEVLNEDNMQQDGEVPSVDNESTIKLSVIEKNLLNTGKVLKNAFIGNFPGTELKMVNNVTEKDKGIVGKADIIRESLKEAKYITAVSSVPAIRNANESKNLEFIQGLEKLIETMRGKKYSMIILLPSYPISSTLLLKVLD